MGIIYIATNLLNGKKYIGQTIQPLSTRISQHKYQSKLKTNNHFHNAIKKYGIESFEWKELFNKECPVEYLNNKEIHFIKLYNTTNKLIGYNKDSGGKNNIMSEDTKQKISISRKNSTHAVNKKISDSNKESFANKNGFDSYSKLTEKIRELSSLELTMSEVARETYIKVGTIYSISKKYKITFNKKNSYTSGSKYKKMKTSIKYGLKSNDEMFANIYKLKANGFKLKEIGSIIGMSSQAVCAYLSRESYYEMKAA